VNGQMLGMMMKSEIGRVKEKARFGRMIFCKVYFIVVLWALICCFPLSKGVCNKGILFCVVELLRTRNNDLFQVSCLLFILFSF
jgi:hypothetical protein